jgi:hypothetical protein
MKAEIIYVSEFVTGELWMLHKCHYPRVKLKIRVQKVIGNC